MNSLYTWIEINKTAFEYNVANLKSIIGNGLLAAVIKSNAYGHGMFQVAELAQASKNVDWLCVANLSDALKLDERGISKPILVMSCIDADPGQAIGKNIAFVVPDMVTAERLNRSLPLASSGRTGEEGLHFENSELLISNEKTVRPEELRDTVFKFKIHIKIDTGLRRFGLEPNEAIETIERIAQLPNLHIQGLMTHFAQSQKPDQSFTHQQLEKYYSVLEALEKRGIEIPLKHVANSAATMRLDLPICNFFRVGVGIYGWWPNQALREEVEKKHPQFSLQPIITWKTRINGIKTIPAGEPVGYDCTVTTTRETRVAFIPIGYFDGFDFRLSNTGYANIAGIPVPILGRVSMNVAMLDITDAPMVQQGDEVIVLGPQAKVTAYDWVQNTGNPNIRELITTVNPSITRVIVEHALDLPEISSILSEKYSAQNSPL